MESRMKPSSGHSPMLGQLDLFGWPGEAELQSDFPLGAKAAYFLSPGRLQPSSPQFIAAAETPNWLIEEYLKSHNLDDGVATSGSPLLDGSPAAASFNADDFLITSTSPHKGPQPSEVNDPQGKRTFTVDDFLIKPDGGKEELFGSPQVFDADASSSPLHSVQFGFQAATHDSFQGTGSHRSFSINSRHSGNHTLSQVQPMYPEQLLSSLLDELSTATSVCQPVASAGSSPEYVTSGYSSPTSGYSSLPAASVAAVPPTKIVVTLREALEDVTSPQGSTGSVGPTRQSPLTLKEALSCNTVDNSFLDSLVFASDEPFNIEDFLKSEADDPDILDSTSFLPDLTGGKTEQNDANSRITRSDEILDILKGSPTSLPYPQSPYSPVSELEISPQRVLEMENITEESFQDDISLDEILSEPNSIDTSNPSSVILISPDCSEVHIDGPAVQVKTVRLHSYKQRSSRKAAAGMTRQPKPPATDKKLRKKEQNKRAAMRYRQKNKRKEEVIATELEELEEQQRKLREIENNLSTEIKYYKKIMRELLLARGKRARKN